MEELKNDLILITSYHPTLKQEDMLRNLVNNISNLSKNFDIMISSHSYIPKDICDKVNYVIYDKENKILTGDEHRATLWVKLTDNYKINTQYVGNQNTMLAVWKLSILAFSLAKSLGYNKIHKVEYDTIINDLSEFEDNSKLLDEYDTVFYGTTDLMSPFNLKDISGMVQSIKVSKIPSLLLSYNEDKIMEYYHKKSRNIPERLRHLLEVENKNKIYYKNLNLLNTSSIRSGLVHRSNNNWYVPYYDSNGDELRFLVRRNDSSIPNPKIELIINDKYQKLDLPTTPNYWFHMPLMEYKKVNLLKVLVNGKMFYEIDFTILDKEKFKNHNYAEHL
jgi:hypothetical protein